MMNIFRAMGRYIGRRPRSQALEMYKKVVVGGELLLSPLNFPGLVFKMPATSDLAKRIAITGNYEQDVTKYLDSIDFDDRYLAINIGANVGLFACFLAQKFERVLALEPCISALDYLRHNLYANDMLERVEISDLAASDQIGECEMEYIENMPEYSTIVSKISHKSALGYATKRLKINVTTIDNLCADRDLAPGILFIDVEGGEKKVIDGALAVIDKHKPHVVIEVSDALLSLQGVKSSDIVRLMSELNYSWTSILGGGSVNRSTYDGMIHFIPPN